MVDGYEADLATERGIATRLETHSRANYPGSKAVLVAIAIPVFTTQLEKSREATDLANLRSAYAEKMTEILTWDGKTAITATKVTAKQTQANWQSDGNATSTKIADGLDGAGIDVPQSTKGWDITVSNPTDGSAPAITISAKS